MAYFAKVHLFYARRQCGALNSPYWNEKGLAASFDLPQQILTCPRNFGFIFKQTELLSMQSVSASPTSAPPIHANNQAMQHMAYSQWHCWGLKAYSTAMRPCTSNSSFIPTLSFQACWIEKRLPLGDYHSHLRSSQEYDTGGCQPM